MTKRRLVFFLASLLFILSQFYRVSNAIIAPRLEEDLLLTAEQLGLLSAVFFYVFALAQVPLGMAIDRFGGRVTMAVLSAVGAGGALIFASSPSFAAALLGRGLLGLGMAGNLMGSMKLLSHWFFPSEFATLPGAMLALGTLGNMLAATPLAAAGELFGWIGSFGILGVVTLLLAALFFMFVEERSEETVEAMPSSSRPGAVQSLLSLYGNRDYWIISMATFFR